MEELIAKYGYAGVLIGTFFEGETILIAAGFLAHQGYLELPWVILAALAGTLGGDQMYYYIGRSKGPILLEKRPQWQLRSARVNELLERHQILIILAFRFLYGIRTITPFLIGAGRIAPRRFFILNLVGAAVWATVIGSAGYFLGHTLEIVLEESKRYEFWVLAALAGMGGLFWLAWRFSPWPRRANKKNDAGVQQ